MADPKPTRAEEVRQERRRKPGSVTHTGIKLTVDERKLDRSTYQYRFVNDTENRVQQLMAEDWDPVTDPTVKPDGNSVGTTVTTQAGILDGGKPYNNVLMKKRKDWFEADQKEKQKPLDAMEDAIRRGRTAEQNIELKGADVYTPNGVNIIDRAS